MAAVRRVDFLFSLILMEVFLECVSGVLCVTTDEQTSAPDPEVLTVSWRQRMWGMAEGASERV